MGTVTVENIEVTGLPQRQAEALAHAALGRSAKETGLLMHISYRTVETNLVNVMQRLGACNRVHMITKAVAAGALAVRDGGSTLAIVAVLGLCSLPASDLDQTDWARLQAKPVRVRNRREDLIDDLLPQAA